MFLGTLEVRDGQNVLGSADEHDELGQDTASGGIQGEIDDGRQRCCFGEPSAAGIGAYKDSTASSACAAPSAENPKTRSPMLTSATPSPSSSTMAAAS